MMPVPDVPLMTDNVVTNQQRLIDYLHVLTRYLREGEPDPEWQVIGTAQAKALSSGATLTSTQDVLGTLIQTLQQKGLL